jgi:hypothetical protein
MIEGYYNLNANCAKGENRNLRFFFRRRYFCTQGYPLLGGVEALLGLVLYHIY